MINTTKMNNDYSNKPMYNIWMKLRMSGYTVPFKEFNSTYGPERPGMVFSNTKLEWITRSEHRRRIPKSSKTNNKYKGVVEKVTKYGKVYWYATYQTKMIKGSTNYISAEDCSRLREVWMQEHYPIAE